MSTAKTIYITKVRTPFGKQAASLLIDSLRAFGGDLSEASFWLFEIDAVNVPCDDLEDGFVRVIPLDVPQALLNYDLGDKVYTCAKAEALAPPEAESLVWIDPLCLVVNPPALYCLGADFDVALRPVHIRNVGASAAEPLDGYWRKVYEAVGVEAIQATVDSFVDQQHIRAYYNTHAFAIHPAKRLLGRWLDVFERLVCDPAFQAGSCKDELHQVFLHQAAFSALVASTIDPGRIRPLPPEYNYPFNLQGVLDPSRRAQALNDLVTFTYEDRGLKPDTIDDIEIREPLKTWLAKYAQ